MSKQSEAKERQGYVAKCPHCGKVRRLIDTVVLRTKVCICKRCDDLAYQDLGL